MEKLNIYNFIYLYAYELDMGYYLNLNLTELIGICIEYKIK